MIMVWLCKKCCFCAFFLCSLQNNDGCLMIQATKMIWFDKNVDWISCWSGFLSPVVLRFLALWWEVLGRKATCLSFIHLPPSLSLFALLLLFRKSPRFSQFCNFPPSWPSSSPAVCEPPVFLFRNRGQCGWENGRARVFAFCPNHAVSCVWQSKSQILSFMLSISLSVVAAIVVLFRCR